MEIYFQIIHPLFPVLNSANGTNRSETILTTDCDTLFSKRYFSRRSPSQQRGAAIKFIFVGEKRSGGTLSCGPIRVLRSGREMRGRDSSGTNRITPQPVEPVRQIDTSEQLLGGPSVPSRHGGEAVGERCAVQSCDLVVLHCQKPRSRAGSSSAGHTQGVRARADAPVGRLWCDGSVGSHAAAVLPSGVLQNLRHRGIHCALWTVGADEGYCALEKPVGAIRRLANNPYAVGHVQSRCDARLAH